MSESAYQISLCSPAGSVRKLSADERLTATSVADASVSDPANAIVSVGADRCPLPVATLRRCFVADGIVGRKPPAKQKRSSALMTARTQMQQRLAVAGELNARSRREESFDVCGGLSQHVRGGRGLQSADDLWILDAEERRWARNSGRLLRAELWA